MYPLYCLILLAIVARLFCATLVHSLQNVATTLEVIATQLPSRSLMSHENSEPLLPTAFSDDEDFEEESFDGQLLNATSIQQAVDRKSVV